MTIRPDVVQISSLEQQLASARQQISSLEQQLASARQQMSSLEQQLTSARQQSSVSTSPTPAAPLAGPSVPDRAGQVEVEHADAALLDAQMRFAQAEHLGQSMCSVAAMRARYSACGMN